MSVVTVAALLTTVTVVALFYIWKKKSLKAPVEIEMKYVVY